MLYFKTNTGACIEWHVGERVPTIFQPKRKPEYWPNGQEKDFPDIIVVTEVYADGDELDWILCAFSYLPQRSNANGKVIKNVEIKASRAMTWFGDMARFIHANL